MVADAANPGSPSFETSSYSATNCACVAVARSADEVAVRDSKRPAGPVLHFSPEAWSAFIADLRGGLLSRNG